MAKATTPTAMAATSLPYENMAAPAVEMGDVEATVVAAVVVEGALVVEERTERAPVVDRIVLLVCAVTADTITTDVAVVEVCVEVISVLFTATAVVEVLMGEVAGTETALDALPVVAYVVVAAPSTTQGTMSM